MVFKVTLTVEALGLEAAPERVPVEQNLERITQCAGLPHFIHAQHKTRVCPFPHSLPMPCSIIHERTLSFSDQYFELLQAGWINAFFMKTQDLSWRPMLTLSKSQIIRLLLNSTTSFP